MDALHADDDFMPTFYCTPRIAGAFTDWHYKDMREIIPFCMDNDENPPDFAEMLFTEKVIKKRLPLNPKELTEEQKKLLDGRKNRYYEENWSKMILKIMRFRNPLVANAHTLTSITNTIDSGSKVYFHIGWLKPGRHNFVIQHDNDEIQMGDEPKPPPVLTMASLFGLKKKTEEAVVVVP